MAPQNGENNLFKKTGLGLMHTHFSNKPNVLLAIQFFDKS